MTPEVTAIVTCMTDAERPFLRATLDSVRDQTAPCATLLLVAEDNPWVEAMVQDLPRLTVMRRRLAPVGAIRNAGIAAATTEYVALLDGDDVWRKEKTARQLAFLRGREADFVAVDHMLMREEGQVFAYGSARYMAMPSAWMARRDLMLRHPFDPEARGGLEDGIWWRGTWGRVAKHRLPEPLLLYRVRNASLSSLSRGKRRKLAMAKISALPLARPLVLGATWLAFHRFDRRGAYLAHPHWPFRTSSTAGLAAA